MLFKSKYPTIYVFELQEDVFNNKKIYIRQNGQRLKDSRVFLYLDQEIYYRLHNLKSQIIKFNKRKAVKILLDGSVWWIDKSEIKKV